MTDEPNPGYYAITPASVRYSKNLCANAKLLYGEITALCHKEGYCWAENSYFARLYSVKKETVSGWLRQLRDNRLIKIEIDQKKGNKRKIFIAEDIGNKMNTSSDFLYNGRIENRNTYSQKIDSLYNNTINTTLNNTKINVVSRSEGRNDKYFFKKNYLLRPDDQEFNDFYHMIAGWVQKENRERPHNPFKWLPKSESFERDLKILVYGNLPGCKTKKETDEKKKKLLYNLQNTQAGKLNWVSYVTNCIKYTIITTRKKPVTNPFGFTYSLLFKPAIITSALADGILSMENISWTSKS